MRPTTGYCEHFENGIKNADSYIKLTSIFKKLVILQRFTNQGYLLNPL